MAPVRVWALIACAVVVVGCDDAETPSDRLRAGTAAAPDGRVAVASVGCQEAIRSRVDPDWRARSVTRGRVGLYGNAADIRTADRWGRSAFWTKIPAIVDGHRPARIRVSDRDRGRVGLTYGPSASSPATSRDGDRGLATAAREIRFVPCRRRAPTAWAGGLVLADRAPVRFEVLLRRGWTALDLP